MVLVFNKWLNLPDWSMASAVSVASGVQNTWEAIEKRFHQREETTPVLSIIYLTITHSYSFPVMELWARSSYRFELIAAILLLPLHFRPLLPMTHSCLPNRRHLKEAMAFSSSFPPLLIKFTFPPSWHNSESALPIYRVRVQWEMFQDVNIPMLTFAWHFFSVVARKVCLCIIQPLT